MTSEKKNVVFDRTKQQRINLFKNCMPSPYNTGILQQLEKDGFFTAPAAASHHGNYEGGLFDHSFAVACQLVDYTQSLGLHWERKESPYIVGMLHDYCKTKLYTKQEDGTFTHTENVILPGHGSASVALIQQFLQLTFEELMCIRWHMGAFEGEKYWKGYSAACCAYPNVLYTHTADMYVSQCMGI
nr:MAG TPA: putative HD superfamily hydrolase [Caudoviricetes sp.]